MYVHTYDVSINHYWLLKVVGTDYIWKALAYTIYMYRYIHMCVCQTENQFEVIEVNTYDI